jgi:hypothetical protein
MIIASSAVAPLAWRLATDRAGAIRRMILAHVPATRIEAGAIDAFAADFLAQRSLLREGVAIDRACGLLGIGSTAPACVDNARYMRRMEEQIVDLFLRSTNIFEPTGDRSAPIRYVAFWDPYSLTCRNPFAEFDLPPT